MAEIETGNANGMVEIFKTFIKYPGATIQLVTILGGGFGVYYALTTEIHEVRSEVRANHDEATAQVKAVLTADVDERAKLESLYARGDTRYQAITSRLAEHDTKLASISVNVDWIVRRLDTPQAQQLLAPDNSTRRLTR